jgi:hypothetical protein
MDDLTTITLTDAQIEAMSFALDSLYLDETTIMESEWTHRDLSDAEVFEHIAKHRNIAHIEALLSSPEDAERWNKLADECSAIPIAIKYEGAYVC